MTPCWQGSYVLNNFLERLSGQRLYARLHDVLLDTGALQSLHVADTDWSDTPTAPAVSYTSNTVSLSWNHSGPICAVYFKSTDFISVL